jgi:hypothetical protein
MLAVLTEPPESDLTGCVQECDEVRLSSFKNFNGLDHGQ